jgi:hypothetical protein
VAQGAMTTEVGAAIATDRGAKAHAPAGNASNRKELHRLAERPSLSRQLSPYSSSFYCRRYHLHYSLLAMVIVD